MGIITRIVSKLRTGARCQGHGLPSPVRLEALESRTLMSGAPHTAGHRIAVPAVTPAHGLSVTVFATNPAGASQPDSIAVDGSSVYVGYGNGVAKDGSDGKSSTIVQYTTAGAVVRTFSVPGHNDGLKVDPSTHRVWALQNEDGNPNLVVIDPVAVRQTNYTFAAPPADGGGYDDIVFLNGKVFLSESNPSSNPNTAPAIVQATLGAFTVTVTPVLLGNATTTSLVTHHKVTLNLQDPDSMTADPSGSLLLTSQADDELITVKHPGAANQSVTVAPLTDAAHTPVSVDDTLFPSKPKGSVLLTDLTAGIIYQITGSALKPGLTLSAAQDIGEVGKMNLKTGRFTPIITGLQSPRGLAFLPEIKKSA